MSTAGPHDEGPPPVADPPERIGRYRILESLGEGGMGIVYLAEQTEPIHRRVAIKVMKPGMDSRQVLARFEAERQALAIMSRAEPRDERRRLLRRVGCRRCRCHG